MLVVAPLELRVRRVMNDLKVDEKSAKREVDRFDGGRRQFVRRYFGGDVEDPLHYDLVVNTERLSYDSAASVIVDALATRDEAAA